MSELKVDTEEINRASRQLNNVNHNIDAKFSSIKIAVNNLFSCWSGDVSDKAKDVFSLIDRKYKHSRYNVMVNQSNFLSESVAKGYEDAEKNSTINKLLRDK